MKLSVLIVSYNVCRYLEQCLRSVWRAAEGLDCEVFVVDNASADGTVDFLRRRFPATDYPAFHIIANARNVGFGHANNQALRRATGDFVLFLNPDTILTESVLQDALRFAGSHPDLGGLGVRMLGADGRFAYESRRGLPTPWTAFCKMSGLCSLFPRSRRFGRYYMRYLDAAQPAEIEIISGAFLMVRGEAVRRTGGFDERFFMYGEDIDLSYRLLLDGWKNYYIPTPILHYKGESVHSSNLRYVHVFYDAMLIFFNKHFRHYGLLLSVPVRCAVVGKGLLTLLRRQLTDMRRFLRANRRSEERRYLFVGSRAGIAAARDIAAEWVLRMDFEEMSEATHPDGHRALPGGGADYACVIYDASVYSYAAMLRIFAAAPGARQLGTYDPATGAIITHDAVFCRRASAVPAG